MDIVGQFALLTITSVLFIVNPISVIPTDLVITRKEMALGLLLAAIAMQFVISGATDAWHAAAL